MQPPPCTRSWRRRSHCCWDCERVWSGGKPDVNYRSKAIAALVLVVGAGLLGGGTTAAQSLPRERISINDDWRFKKGDPPGHTGRLLYDVRPEVKDERDDRHADAEPQAAAGRGAASIPTLKRW